MNVHSMGTSYCVVKVFSPTDYAYNQKFLKRVFCNGIFTKNHNKIDTTVEGVEGPAGSFVPKDDKGDTGPRGENGDRGLKGDTGAQGAKGDKGDKGDAGAQGPKSDTNAEGPPDNGGAGSQSPKGG